MTQRPLDPTALGMIDATPPDVAPPDARQPDASLSDATPITVFACPPHCPAGAGGPPSDGGHLFDRDWTSKDGRTWSKQCVCGLLAIDWSLWGNRAACSPHRLVRSTRVPSIVTCRDCGEGTHYLFGFPGSPDARALGCVCPPDQPVPDWQAGGGYTVDGRCRLHVPDDERQSEETK